MKVSTSPEPYSRHSNKTEKTEKKTEKKANKKTASKGKQEPPAADEGAAAKTSDKVTLSAKDASKKEAAPAKAATPPPAPAKASSDADKGLKEAETLMDHVNSGKLSDDEKQMAMKRVGELLKRYGNA